jgi:hypothetical protein
MNRRARVAISIYVRILDKLDAIAPVAVIIRQD